MKSARLTILLLLLAMTATARVIAYPLDGYAETGIRRVEGARLASEGVIAGSKQPLVFFALQWCEFCWSARKLLDALEVPYRTVALDGPDYADLEWAADVRRAVGERSGAPTIPQIFLAGKHLGGATDLFDAHNDGRLVGLLADANLAVKQSGPENAYSLLPAWLQPR